MSRLYYSEEGRVIPSLCEELSIFKRARKFLRLPPTEVTGTVYILARCHENNRTPLHLSINKSELAPIIPERPGSYHWYSIKVDPILFNSGENCIEFWAETNAMDGWSLALETGHSRPGSAISDDGGQQWRCDRMGYLNAVLGEYVVRVRLEEGEDLPPSAIIWERPDHPRVHALRQHLPANIFDTDSVMDKVSLLSSWLASSWEHTGGGRAEQYSPWDAETIMSWGSKKVGHNGRRPIAMCVHYTAAFVSAAQTIGIPARCAVLTEALNGPNGHFVAEVWDAKLDKWWVVDANSDALFFKSNTPMSMTEIQEAGSDLRNYIEYGSGTDFQRTFPHMVVFLQDILERGVCFGHRSIWFRSDLLSRPELSPPGHGSLCYCETGLIWEQKDRTQGFDMFPSFGDADFFNSPPAIVAEH